MGRDAPVVAARRSVRACVWVGAVIGLGLTVFSINGLAHSARTLRDTGFTSGPAGVAERAGAVWRSLGRHPSAFIDEDEQPGLLKIAGYVRACTEPGDRLSVLGVYPELYYFADRRFAGGHAWLLPLYVHGHRRRGTDCCAPQSGARANRADRRPLHIRSGIPDRVRTR